MATILTFLGCLLGLYIIYRYMRRWVENSYNTFIAFSWFFVLITGICVDALATYGITVLFSDIAFLQTLIGKALIFVGLYLICCCLFVSPKFGKIFMAIYGSIIFSALFMVLGYFLLPQTVSLYEDITIEVVLSGLLGLAIGIVWGRLLKVDADNNGSIFEGRAVGFDKNYWDTPEGKKQKREMKAEKKLQKQIKKYNRINNR